MTQPPEYDQVPTLQPLTFQPVPAPVGLAVYQARVKDETAPGAPEYVLTATTSSPVDDAEKAGLEDLLSKIRAAFRLITEPIPTDSGDIPEDATDVPPEPFDPKTQIEFGLGIEFASPGPTLAGIAATMEATTGPLAVDFHDIVDPYKKDHVWQSSGGPQQATVRIGQGRGTIRPPRQPVVAGGGVHGRYHAFGTQVIVHADVRMVYDLDGNFIPPH